MKRIDALSVRDAAARLDLNEARVKALIKSEALPATKIAGRWLIDPDAVERRRAQRPPSGRPFTEVGAWAAIDVMRGLRPEVSASMLSRLRRDFSSGPADPARLRSRARVRRYRAHPGTLHALAEEEILLTGVSAAEHFRLGLLSSPEVDAYVRAIAAATLVKKYALIESDEPNVTLRIVQRGPFRRGGEDRFAPLLVVALDLCDSQDSRVAAVGRRILESRRW